MAQIINAPSRIHTARRLNFSEGLHWCENCVEGASREPAMYFLMTLERIEAEKSF